MKAEAHVHAAKATGLNKSRLQLRNSRASHPLPLIAVYVDPETGRTHDSMRKVQHSIHGPVLRRITIGEVVAVAKPTTLTTLLGSCVAVCLRDPISGVAGMNHILLPEGPKEEGRARFGVQAMELLINEIMILGADRRRLVAKAFGAGNMFTSLLRPTVGEMNARFVRDFLALEGIRLVAERLGGESAVEIHFRSDTGKVIVSSVNGSPLSAIAAMEEAYRRTPAAMPVEGEITLF